MNIHGYVREYQNGSVQHPSRFCCAFLPPTRMPLARSTPVLYGLKVLVRLGEVGPDSNAPADGTAMYGGWGGRRVNNNEKKKKAHDQLHQNITTRTNTPHPTSQCNITCKILKTNTSKTQNTNFIWLYVILNSTHTLH